MFLITLSQQKINETTSLKHSYSETKREICNFELKWQSTKNPTAFNWKSMHYQCGTNKGEKLNFSQIWQYFSLKLKWESTNEALIADLSASFFVSQQQATTQYIEKHLWKNYNIYSRPLLTVDVILRQQLWKRAVGKLLRVLMRVTGLNVQGQMSRHQLHGGPTSDDNPEIIACLQKT